MKYVLFVLALLVSVTASAEYPRPYPPRPTYPPVPSYPPVPTPVPTNPRPGEGDVKGRVHRLSMQIERESTEAVALAKQVFQRGLYDRLTDEEVRAVAELAFVQDAARDFREAVASENYADNPVLSRQAYMWLHRAYAVVEHDPMTRSQPELVAPNSPVLRMERTMQRLREFYQLAERQGWSMAEVTLLGDEFERHTTELTALASREVDGRREGHILRLFQDLQNEAAQFAREAHSVVTPGSARVILNDNFQRLQYRFGQLDRIMADPRFNHFSQVVRSAYSEAELTYRDMQLAFGGVHNP